MSDLSELIHGHVSLPDFLAKEVGRVEWVAAHALTPDQLAQAENGAADEIETVKVAVQGYAHAFLSSKGVAGGVADKLVQNFLNGIAAALEAAAHAAAGKAAEQNK